MILLLNPAFEGIKDNINEYCIQIAETIKINDIDNQNLTNGIKSGPQDVTYSWDEEIDDEEITHEATKHINQDKKKEKNAHVPKDIETKSK